MDPADVWTLVEQSKEHWGPRNDRFEEDLGILCNRWPVEEPTGTTALTDPEPDLPADTTIPEMYQKFVSVIANAEVALSIRPTLPQHANLVELAQDAWRSAEHEWARRFARSGLGVFAVEETEWACGRGWITQRVWFNADRYLKGEFAVEVQQVDPATVFPVWGADGLEWVVQEYDAKKADVLRAFPELAERDIKGFKEAGLFDEVTLTAAYTKGFVYYFVDGDPVDTTPTGLDFVPWIVIPCRDYTRATGMATGVGLGGTRTTSRRGAGRAETLTRYVGLPCFFEAKGPVRNRKQLMAVNTRMLELGVLPVTMTRAADGSAIEVDLQPGANIELGPPGTDNVEILQWQPAMENMTTAIQYYTAEIDKRLPSAAWGIGPQSASGFDRAQMNATMYNAFSPYVVARELACELRWDYTMRMYAAKATADRPMQFGRTVRNNRLGLGQLGPDDFEVLLDADVDTKLRNLLPSDRQTMGVLVATLLRSGVIDPEAALGPEFLALPDYKHVLRRVEAQKMKNHPGPIGMTSSAEAFQFEYPDQWAYAERIFEAEQQAAEIEVATRLRQAQMAWMQAGMPPMQPGPNGPMQQNTPNQPHPPPPTGPTPGGPPRQRPDLPAGPALPPGAGEPGMAAMAAGLPSVPGGMAAINPPGVRTEVMSPYMAGQTQLPQAQDPVLDMIREMQGGLPPI